MLDHDKVLNLRTKSKDRVTQNVRRQTINLLNPTEVFNSEALTSKKNMFNGGAGGI